MKFLYFNILIFSLFVASNGNAETCLNGGFFVLNKCVCLPNFTGLSCEIEIISSVNISKPTTSHIQSLPVKQESSTSANLIETTPPVVIGPLINKLYDVLYKGVSDGFFEFINYVLVMQGLGDLTTLSEDDMELLLNIFVSTVNTEIDAWVFNLTKTNPYYDQNKTDDNLHDKVAHLTENLLVLLSLEFENMVNGSSNDNNQSENKGFCSCLSKLILNLLIMLEQKFGLPQDIFVNSIASELLSSYISTNLMNEACDSSTSDNNIFRSSIEDLISSAISNQVSKVKNQLSNATKNRKRRAIDDILPKEDSSSKKLSLNIKKEHKVEHKKTKRDSMTLIRLLMKRYVSVQ